MSEEAQCAPGTVIGGRQQARRRHDDRHRTRGKSPPDGYTLLIGPIGAALIAQIYYRKDYDMRRDLAPISKIGYGTIVLVVALQPRRHVGQGTDRVGQGEAGQLTFASSGTGSNIHLTGEMFKQRAGIDIVHVPDKGSALMLPDLIEGRVSMALDSMPAHLPHIKTGRLRALAVASPQRSAQLPDVPTISEAGLARLSVEHGLRALCAGQHAERNHRAPQSRDGPGAPTGRSEGEARGARHRSQRQHAGSVARGS